MKALAERLDEKQSAVIRRVMVLKRKNFVERHRTNQQIYYSLEANTIRLLVQRLQQLSGRPIVPETTTPRNRISRWIRRK